jgi:site-specific recombinase XerD
LQEYHQNLSDFFHIKSNSSVNKDLKKIGVLAKIEKHFSFHTARHTNATLLIYNGAQITTVQKLLGHQSVKTTQRYSDIFSGTIVKDLKKCKF